MRSFLVILSVLTATAAAAAAEPTWALEGWPYRIRLHLRAGQNTRPEIRTGTAEVVLCGRSKPDGSDLRLTDTQGKVTPFRIDVHDPHRTTHLTFRVDDPKQDLWLYHGNMTATAIDTASPGRLKLVPQARMKRWLTGLGGWVRGLEYYGSRAATGSVAGLTGPPAVPLATPFFDEAGTLLALTPEATKAAPAPRTVMPTVESMLPRRWQPDGGLLVRTLAKKNVNEHPRNLAEMRRMISEATETYGGTYQREPYLGYNPFGPSDGYITIMDGSIFIDRPGVYAFCTQSDEASFLLIDGKMVVEWPGQHDWNAGRYGEKNGEIALTRGRHHVEYLHEEGTGNQMAFFGWAPPGARRWTRTMRIPRFAGMKQFSSIPSTCFPLPLTFDNHLLERHDGKPLAARCRINQQSSTWLRHASPDRQVDMIQFQDTSVSSAGTIVQRTWDFGDGIVYHEPNKPDPQHVFLRQGDHTVTLTVKDEKGNSDTCVIKPRLFHIRVNVRHAYPYVRQEAFWGIAKDYDVNELDKDSLAGLLLFCHSQEAWQEQAKVGEALLRRFKDFPPDDWRRYHMLAGEAFRHRDVARYKEALAAFQAAAVMKDVNRNEQVRAQLEAAAVQWEFLGQHAEAIKSCQAVIAEYEKAKYGWMREHAQTAMITIGDSLLAQGRRKEAVEQYLKVKDLGGYDAKTGADREEMDRGTFDSNVWDHLDQNLLAEAWILLDQWERKYPWHKPEGYTFYLRTRIRFVEGRLADAVAWADKAVTQDPKANFAIDCLWLKGQSLQKLEKYDDAIATYRTLLLMPGAKDFQQAAEQRIKDCEGLKAKGAEKK